MSGTRKRELEDEGKKEITKCCMAFETKDQICIYLYHGNPDNKPVTLPNPNLTLLFDICTKCGRN